MSNQAKFLDLPTEPPPLNRRVYAAATAPFGYLWEFVRWVGLPWFQALPFALVAATAAAVLNHQEYEAAAGLTQVAIDALSVGLIWTGYLGAVFAVVKVVRAIFK